MENFWRKCSTCKEEIGFSKRYWVCNVSSCNVKRTGGLVFCKVSCWDAHNPVMSHKSSYAIEKVSPKKEEATTSAAVEASSAPSSGQRRLVSGNHSTTLGPKESETNSDDVLVVISKFKNYVKEKGDMNTSGDVAPYLSDILRRIADEAILSARQDGRKTVMARDIKF